MSTTAGSSAADAKSGDRRMSLGKYVKRMSSVFKREKSSKAAGDSGAPIAPSENARQQNVEEGAVEVEATPAAPFATANPASPTTSVTGVASPASPTVVTKQIDRHAMQQERARVLFAKYGLTLDTQDWITGPAPVPTVQRVEKAIRMRVHRTCHRCGTTYGSAKQCLQCQHKRCNKCPRYPKKKTSSEQDKAADEKPKKKRVLTITTRGGNELTYQPVKQRVRRTCHKCEAIFVPSSATSCEQCQNVRCNKCLRESAKLQKRPDGHPGDVDAESDSEVEKQLEMFRRTWRKPRQRVRWECEQCHRSFISGSPQCPGCGHERCEKCVRSPIKNTRKEEMFDPQLVAAVEAKLKALEVDTDALASGVDVA